MIKLIGKRARLLLLASVLLGTIFGSFHGWATVAQVGPEEPILFDGGSGGGTGGGGGNYYCPSPSGCGNFGCHARSIADPTQICSQYVIVDGASCPSPIDCRQV
jgi:hypothetical protein